MSYYNYYPWINANQISNTNIAGDNSVGKGLNIMRSTFLGVANRNNYLDSSKNYLKASILWLDPNNAWWWTEWPRIYTSGWNSVADVNVFSAGDVIAGKGNGNRKSFENNRNGDWWTDIWPSLLGGNLDGKTFVHTDYQLFAMKNAHTEQTFFVDVLRGQRPNSITNGVVPKVAILYLFSSRDPCLLCQRSLNRCIDQLSGFANRFLTITFNIQDSQAAQVDFRLFMNHQVRMNPLFSNNPVTLQFPGIRLFLTIFQPLKSILPEKDENSKDTKDITNHILVDNDDDNKNTHVAGAGDNKSVQIDGDMVPKLLIEADSLVNDSK